MSSSRGAAFSCLVALVVVAAVAIGALQAEPVAALRAGFTQLWQATLNNATKSSYSAGNCIAQYVPKHKMYIVSDKNNTIYGIDTTSGAIHWTRSVCSVWRPDQGFPGFAVGTDFIGVTCGDTISIEITSGAIKWTSFQGLSSINGNAMAALPNSNHAVIVEGENGLSLLDLSTGKNVWKNKEGAKARSFRVSKTHVAILSQPDFQAKNASVMVFSLSDGSRVWTSKVFREEQYEPTPIIGIEENIVGFMYPRTLAGRFGPCDWLLYDFVADKLVFSLRTVKGVNSFRVIDGNLIIGVSYTNDNYVFAQNPTNAYIAGIDLKNNVTYFNRTLEHTAVVGSDMLLHEGRIITSLGVSKTFPTSTKTQPHFLFASIDLANGKTLSEFQVPTTKNRILVMDGQDKMLVPNLAGLTVVDARTSKPTQYSLNYQNIIDTSVTALGNRTGVFVRADKVVCVKY